MPHTVCSFLGGECRLAGHPLLTLDLAAALCWTVFGFVSHSHIVGGTWAQPLVTKTLPAAPPGCLSLVVLNCLHLFSRLMNQLQIMLQWMMSCKVKTNLF